jgi:hypothetical protein
MRIAALFLLLGLNGCGDTLWSDLGTSLSGRAATEEGTEPEGRALRISIGRRAAYATLLQETGLRRLWRTANGIVVATDGARVVATSGLGEMLAATRFDGPDPLADPAELLERPAEARRSVDLMRADRAPEGMRFGIPVECRMRALKTEDAGILLVEERCAAAGGRFTNRFWVEAEGGAVLRTEQWVGPGVPMLSVEFL